VHGYMNLYEYIGQHDIMCDVLLYMPFITLGLKLGLGFCAPACYSIDRDYHQGCHVFWKTCQGFKDGLDDWKNSKRKQKSHGKSLKGKFMEFVWSGKLVFSRDYFTSVARITVYKRHSWEEFLSVSGISVQKKSGKFVISMKWLSCIFYITQTRRVEWLLHIS